MKITKQIKVRFFFDSDDSEHKATVYKKLQNCIYLTWKALNTSYNEYIFQHINRDKKGESYTKEEQKKFQNSGYQAIKDFDLPSYIRASISQTAFKRYKNDIKSGGVLSGKRTWTNFRLYSPMPFMKSMINLENMNNEYIFKMPYFSTGYNFNLMVIRNEQKVILDRIINGEYQLNDSNIQWDKQHNKWFLNLSFSFQKEANKAISKDIVVGVDLGVAVPVMCALNTDNYRRLSIGHRKEIDDFRNRIKLKRLQILRENKKIYELRTGHGRSGKLKPIGKLENRINNFMQTYNHKLSRAIVNFALENNAGYINFEDLSNFSDKKQQDYYLRDWNIYDIINKTEYKAKEHGIIIRKVNPQYTSQCCSKCNFIDPENRETQAQFNCSQCSYSENADFNAARNISLLDEKRSLSIETNI